MQLPRDQKSKALALLAATVLLASTEVGTAATLAPPLPTELEASPTREPLDSAPRVSLPPKPVTRNVRWGAGMRIQSLLGEPGWLELGADGVVYPWRHLGLGITALQGRSLEPVGCGTTLAEPCGAAFRTVASFLELRLIPDFWLSPYARGTLGIAWGDLTTASGSPSSVALASRSELGLDFHHGASARLYFAAARMDGDSTSTGLGFGLQFGLNL